MHTHSSLSLLFHPLSLSSTHSLITSHALHMVTSHDDKCDLMTSGQFADFKRLLLIVVSVVTTCLIRTNLTTNTLLTLTLNGFYWPQPLNLVVKAYWTAFCSIWDRCKYSILAIMDHVYKTIRTLLQWSLS